MKVLTDYNELVGKTIAFSHMAQFAKQITIATTDNEVLMATFDMDECGEESNIRIYHEWHVLDTIKKHEWLRKELGKLGIFDLEEYNRQQEEERIKRVERNKKLEEERERKLLAKLKEKYENQ